MKRLTMNNTFEMNMHQLALNQVYVGKDGLVRYVEDPDHECSVCDLIRTASETLGVEMPILGDEDLSDLMMDWLQYGAEGPEGVAAILYRALCAMAEVRDKLFRYEDSGLEPEEILTGVELAKIACAMNPLKEYQSFGSTEHFRELAQAEKDGRLVVPQPNAPLTLEELREMDGEPVWVVIAGVGRYAVIEHCGERSTKFTDGMEPPNDRYGTYWLAYRHRPEVGTV